MWRGGRGYSLHCDLWACGGEGGVIVCTVICGHVEGREGLLLSSNHKLEGNIFRHSQYCKGQNLKAEEMATVFFSDR